MLLGMLIVYLITGIVIAIDGVASDWVCWLYAWWIAIPCALIRKVRTILIKNKIKKSKDSGKNE